MNPPDAMTYGVRGRRIVDDCALQGRCTGQGWILH